MEPADPRHRFREVRRSGRPPGLVAYRVAQPAGYRRRRCCPCRRRTLRAIPPAASLRRGSRRSADLADLADRWADRPSNLTRSRRGAGRRPAVDHAAGCRHIRSTDPGRGVGAAISGHRNGPVGRARVRKHRRHTLLCNPSVPAAATCSRAMAHVDTRSSPTLLSPAPDGGVGEETSRGRGRLDRRRAKCSRQHPRYARCTLGVTRPRLHTIVERLRKPETLRRIPITRRHACSANRHGLERRSRVRCLAVPASPSVGHDCPVGLAGPPKEKKACSPPGPRVVAAQAPCAPAGSLQGRDDDGPGAPDPVDAIRGECRDWQV